MQTYRNLFSVPTSTPTGAGGIALDDNFRLAADIVPAPDSGGYLVLKAVDDERYLVLQAVE